MDVVAVDANIIISALIGGKSREVLFSNKYDFITTEFTIAEVNKFLPYIAQKTDFEVAEIEFALKLLPIKIFNKQAYEHKIVEAHALIGKTDMKDVDILALALATSKRLWSNDNHFENIREIILVKTSDLVSQN